MRICACFWSLVREGLLGKQRPDDTGPSARVVAKLWLHRSSGHGPGQTFRASGSSRRPRDSQAFPGKRRRVVAELIQHQCNLSCSSGTAVKLITCLSQRLRLQGLQAGDQPAQAREVQASVCVCWRNTANSRGLTRPPRRQGLRPGLGARVGPGCICQMVV